MLSDSCGRRTPAESRREFLSKSAFGFGSLALGYLLSDESTLASPVSGNPLLSKPPHFAAKAKSVVLLFMGGGPSHVDTFDPKPLLNRLDGQGLPSSFRSEGINLQFIKASESKLMGTRRAFQKYGQSGLEVSNLFPRVRRNRGLIPALVASQVSGRAPIRGRGTCESHRIFSW